MGYTGLATGAGAASGLETLFARLRAEEALANQGRSIDIDQFEAQSLDANRRGILDLGNRNLGENTRQFNEEAPNRTAAAALNTAGARESGVRADTGAEQLSVLRGLRGFFEPPVSGGADTLGSSGAAAGGADSVAGSGAVDSLNNPSGRIRLSAAGLNPNEAFGPPNVDNTDEEQYLTAYAVKTLGAGKTGRDLTFDQRLEAMKMKPQTVIAQGNLNIRSSESALRQQKWKLDIRDAELNLAQDEKIPPAMRPFLLAEFRNRIQNDVTASQSWSQWLNGESVADPSAQIATIYADVMGKAHTAPGAPSAPATTPRRRFNRDGSLAQ